MIQLSGKLLGVFSLCHNRQRLIQREGRNPHNAFAVDDAVPGLDFDVALVFTCQNNEILDAIQCVQTDFSLDYYRSHLLMGIMTYLWNGCNELNNKYFASYFVYF